MSKFLVGRTQCLYLDQFAVSRVCASPPPPEWADVSALIKRGVDKNRLICPNSIEQMIETTGMGKERASSIDKNARQLSSGWCFFPEVEITAHYFVCKVRNIEMTEQHFIHRKTQLRIDESDVYEKLSEHNLKFREMVEDGTITVNTMRTAARGGKRGNKKSRDSVIEIVKDKFATDMKVRLFLLGKFYDPKNYVSRTDHTFLGGRLVSCVSRQTRPHPTGSHQGIRFFAGRGNRCYSALEYPRFVRGHDGSQRGQRNAQPLRRYNSHSGHTPFR